MLVLSRREVVELIDVDALIAALADAMVDLSAGRASVPSLFPRNAGTELPTHQAVIAVFDADIGRPAALLDGTAITAMRTGAGRRSRPGCSRARTPRRSRSSGQASRPARTRAR